MKEDIHPKYNKNTKVECACGNAFEVGSTKDKIEVEICSNCHPFYTKQEKIVDKMGRVEKFKQRMKKSQEMTKEKEKREEKKEKKKETEENEEEDESKENEEN